MIFKGGINLKKFSESPAIVLKDIFAKASGMVCTSFFLASVKSNFSMVIFLMF